MITDATIAAALLWPELAALAAIDGPAVYRRVYTIGPWTLTAHPPLRSITVDRHGRTVGTIGPGETTSLDTDTARRLRRDLHEHVYQHHRRARL